MKLLTTYTAFLALGLTITGCGSAKSDQSGLQDAQASASFQYPTLPVLERPSIIIDNGPRLAAVQPTAHLKFKYSSCAKRSFEVQKQTVTSFNGKTTYIQINKVQAADCAGPQRSRDYQIQISSDATVDGAYIIANPSLIRPS